MFTTYVAITVLAAAANAAAAAFDFARSQVVIGNMARLGIPPAWLFPLGALKAAGALGLLVGCDDWIAVRLPTGFGARCLALTSGCSACN